MKNIKLIDLKEGPLHSTNNYIEALKHMIDVPKIRDYMVMQILITSMNYLRQLHVWHAINYHIKFRDSSRILEQILHIILMIKPLHVFLNSRETVFLENYRFFDKLFHEVFERLKVLAKKPNLTKLI